MIRSVLVFKNHNYARVIYKSGKNRAYTMNKIPKTVMNFMLEETTITDEDETVKLYRKDTNCKNDI